MVKIADDPERLTKGASRVLDRLKAGGVLCARAGAPLEGEAFGRPDFWIEPRGQSAGPAAVRELIRKGKIVSNGDGLLKDCAQTWRLP